jgi:hypothetical protein
MSRDHFNYRGHFQLYYGRPMYKYGERGGVVMDITNQCILPVQTVLRMV